VKKTSIFFKKKKKKKTKKVTKHRHNALLQFSDFPQEGSCTNNKEG